MELNDLQVVFTLASERRESIIQTKSYSEIDIQESEIVLASPLADPGASPRAPRDTGSP